jgi:hypothetical protein
VGKISEIYKLQVILCKKLRVCLDYSPVLPSQNFGVDHARGRSFGWTPDFQIHAKILVTRSVFSPTLGRTVGGQNLRQIIGVPCFGTW